MMRVRRVPTFSRSPGEGSMPFMHKVALDSLGPLPAHVHPFPLRP